MKIPEDIRKCVAFLEYQDNAGYHLAGTVFFVSMSSSQSPDLFFRYAVTARHVIREIEERTIDGNVYFRLNQRGSGVIRVLGKLGSWHVHTGDSIIDAAVMPMSLDESVDWLFWPVECFATEATITETEISAGNEIFLTGLFHRHAGTKRNVPIIRAGIISAMPEERLRIKWWGEWIEMEAYLIEARSISGLSGSPVFVSPEAGYGHDLKTGDPHVLGRDGGMARSFWLLGLMHGHWDVDASEIDMIKADKADAELVNAGIGIVVPAQKILEIIEQPRLEEMRQKEEAKWGERTAATMDAVIEDKEIEKPFTKADFEDALKKASQPESKESQ